MNWRLNFETYATGTAFRVSLTRNQVSVLHAINDGTWDSWQSPTGRDLFEVIVASLDRRGFVECKKSIQRIKGEKAQQVATYKVTPAGSLVIKLLNFARVVPIVMEDDSADAA